MELFKLRRKLSPLDLKHILAILLAITQHVLSQSGTSGSGTDFTSNSDQSRTMDRFSEKIPKFLGQDVLKNTDHQSSSQNLSPRNKERWNSGQGPIPWQDEQLLPYQRNRGQDTPGRSRLRDSGNPQIQDRNRGDEKANLDKVIQEMSNKEQSLRETQQAPRSRTSASEGRTQEKRPNNKDSYNTRDRTRPRDRYRGRTQDTRYREQSSRWEATPPPRWRNRQDSTPPTPWRDWQDRRRFNSRRPSSNSWDSRNEYVPTRPPPRYAGRPRNSRPPYPTHPPPTYPDHPSRGQSSSGTGLHPLGLIDPDLPDGLDDRWQHMQAQKAWEIMNKESGGRGGPLRGSDWKPRTPRYRGSTVSPWPNSKGGENFNGQSSGRAQIWNSGSKRPDRNQERISSGSRSPSVINSKNDRTTGSQNSTGITLPEAREFQGREFSGYLPTPPQPPTGRRRGSINRWSEYMDMMHDYKQDRLQHRMRLAGRQGRPQNPFVDRPDSLAEARQEAREDARQQEGRRRSQFSSPTAGRELTPPRGESRRGQGRRKNDADEIRYRPQPSVYDPSMPMPINATKQEEEGSLFAYKRQPLPKLSDLDKTLQQILVNMNKSGEDPLQQVDNTLQSFLTEGNKKTDGSLHTYPPEQEKKEKASKFTELGMGGEPEGSPSLRFATAASETKVYIGGESNNTNNATKEADPDNEGTTQPSGQSAWRNYGDRDPDPDAENTKPSGRQIWRNYGNNDADPDPDAEDSKGSNRQIWRTREGHEHLLKNAMRHRILTRRKESRRKLGEVEIEDDEVEIEGPLKRILRQMFRQKLIENYRRGRRLIPDPLAAVKSLNSSIRSFFSKNHTDLQVNSKSDIPLENPGYVRTATPPTYAPLPGDFSQQKGTYPFLYPPLHPELSDFQKSPTQVRPSPGTRWQPQGSSNGYQQIPSHLSKDRSKFLNIHRNSQNPIPNMETMWGSERTQSGANRASAGMNTRSPMSLNPLFMFPDTVRTSPLPLPSDKVSADKPPLMSFPKLTDVQNGPKLTLNPGAEDTTSAPDTPIIPLDTVWKTKDVPQSHGDILDTLFDTPDEVVPVTTESMQGSKSSNTTSKSINDDLFESKTSSTKNLTSVLSSGSSQTQPRHATSMSKIMQIPASLPTQNSGIMSDAPAKIMNSVTIKNTSHELKTVTEKMVQVTKMTNKVADVSTTSVFGVIAGIVIGCAVVLGPMICIACRLKGRAKERARKRKAAAESRNREENGIMEAIIMSELGRTTNTEGATGGSFTGGARPKTRSDRSFAQTHYELQSLKSGRHSPTIIVH